MTKRGRFSMAKVIDQFWTNITVAVIGLFVGINNLLRWIKDQSDTRGLVLGVICTLLAVIWLVYVLYTRKSKSDTAD